MMELTRHITHLGLSIAHRWAKGEPISSSTPYVCLIPAESANDFVRVLPPQSFDNYVSIYDGRGLVRPILPRVTAIMPHLTHLCIDLTLGLPEQKGQGAFPPNEFNPQDSIDYIRRLNSEVDHLLEGLSSTAPHLHAARSSAETGPEPEAILPMRTLTHLAITAEAGWECKRRRQKETNEKLVGIFLSCAIGSQRTLRHLDLTGLGPALIHGLEGLELPNLELLRVGQEVPGVKGKPASSSICMHVLTTSPRSSPQVKGKPGSSSICLRTRCRSSPRVSPHSPHSMWAMRACKEGSPSKRSISCAGGATGSATWTSPW